jgi:mannose-1-phosphate guanylyltransferase
MQAVILAGGLGTRLRPLTYTTPKPLLPLLNEPMVDRLIKTLPSEIDRVILAVSYKVDMLREHFEDHDLGKEIILVEEKEPLGTGGAIKNVQKHIDSSFLALNGDVICSLDFNSFIKFHRDSKAKGTISTWEVEDPTRYGILGMDEESRITRFLEKPTLEEAFSKWINAGAYVLEPEVLDLMESETVTSIEREIFPKLAEQGNLFAFKFYGFWVDAGTQAAYLDAQKTLLDNMDIKLDFPKNVNVKKPVIFGRNCLIERSSALGPHVVLGDNVTVHSGTVIYNSTVFSNTIIGSNNELRDVLIGSGCTIEDDVKIGPGAIIGDYQVLKCGSEIPPNAKIGDA